MKTQLSITLFVVLSSIGCTPQPEEPTIDLAAERAALLAADQAWSETAGDVDRFVEAFAEGASFLPPGAPLARGEAIRTTAEQLFSMPGFNLEWVATSAESAAAGDTGYTLGTFELTVEQEGAAMLTVGKYVTIWAKQEDGSWKVEVDTFNADGPPTSLEEDVALQP